MNFIRLVIIGAIGLTIIYLSVAWYCRLVRRERLEKEWDAENPEGSIDVRRKVVEDGVEEFRSSLAYRALLLIYVVPVILTGVAWYVTD